MATMANPRYIRGEFDHTNHRVVALETAYGEIHSTNQPRVLGATTEWYPTEIRLPEGYNDRLPFLLHEDSTRYDFDPEKQVIVIEYPDADFSPRAIRAALVDLAKHAANYELAKTDWYVIRMQETGKDIPESIRQRRQEIRDKSQRYEREIAKASVKDLNDFTITYGLEEGDLEKPEPEMPPGGDGSLWITDATSPDQEGKPVKPAEEKE